MFKNFSYCLRSVVNCSLYVLKLLIKLASYAHFLNIDFDFSGNSAGTARTKSTWCHSIPGQRVVTVFLTNYIRYRNNNSI